MELIAHRITGVDDPYFSEMWKLYLESFPLVEQRKLEDHLLALEDEAFQSIVYLGKQNEVLALLLGWDFPSSYFIEFYAISPIVRGQGFGTKILKNCISKSEKKIILEIEDVCDEYTQRRWNFYSRLGFMKYPAVYVHPPYQEGFDTFNLNVLSYPNMLSKEEYNNFIYEEKKISLNYTFYKGTYV